VCGTRAWTGETNDARGRNFSADGWRLSFKASDGEGGRRGVRHVEAERERERGALARRGIGAAAAQPWRARAVRCRAIVESGGVGATRSTWLTGGPGRDGGPGHQRLGVAR
jgi:hypothetical protein